MIDGREWADGAREKTESSDTDEPSDIDDEGRRGLASELPKEDVLDNDEEDPSDEWLYSELLLDTQLSLESLRWPREEAGVLLGLERSRLRWV